MTTPQPWPDEIVERALNATVCEGECVGWYLEQACEVLDENGVRDIVATDLLVCHTMRQALTAADVVPRAEVEALFENDYCDNVLDPIWKREGNEGAICKLATAFHERALALLAKYEGAK